MGTTTGIEWTDATWNPVRGCSRVSEGCRNCYAETIAARFSGPGMSYNGLITERGQWNGKTVLVEKHLDDPLHWDKPRRIFVNSMSDLFHETIPNDWIFQIIAVMAATPKHTYQILTKRPERMLNFFLRLRDSKPHDSINSRCFDLANALYGGFASWPLPNVWLGVSAEDQKTADDRIPYLLTTPANVRFLSAEPLLGRIEIPYGLQWVIVGGESGPRARLMHPDWVLGLRDQCLVTDVPFFFKQWGEWLPEAQLNIPYPDKPSWPYQSFGDGSGAFRLGKKKAGASLYGREYREFPSYVALPQI